MQVAAFTKSFQDLPIAEVCRAFKGIGLDGLDLTVRPGGHIEPADAQRRLPEAVEAAHNHGLKILLLTTAITDADDDARRLLRAAGKYGIDRIKLGYYRYQPLGTLARQIDQTRQRLAPLVELAARYGVRPCIHIHSGNYIPSHGTLLYELIRDFDPGQVGAYVDALHMTLEGGSAGWRQGLDLLAPWISLAAIKNFDWHAGTRDPSGQQRWHTRTVPVADGIAPIPEFVATLKKLGYDGTYSLHSEYKGGHSYQELDTQACLEQTAKDLAFFRGLF